ncbi:MAG: hypothetical protein Q8O56_06845, partial [Solirubrobacteraceae bacterium]|nr:hypothetical protein [Solirubrobacteraceae bacterium]
MEPDGPPPLVARIRWGNVARAGALLALATLVLAWPHLRADEPALPPAEPVPVAPARPPATQPPAGQSPARRSPETRPPATRGSGAVDVDIPLQPAPAVTPAPRAAPAPDRPATPRRDAARRSRTTR